MFTKFVILRTKFVILRTKFVIVRLFTPYKRKEFKNTLKKKKHTSFLFLQCVDKNFENKSEFEDFEENFERK